MPHYYPIQIFYEDTDALGIVYHANYLKFMERARTVFLQEKGLSLSALIDTFGIQFVIRSVQVVYEQPARLQQKIVVVTEITEMRRATLHFNQGIYLDSKEKGTRICTGEVKVVCTNLQLKPCAIPGVVYRGLKIEN